MSRNRVYVELDATKTNVVRIFKHRSAAALELAKGNDNVTEWPRYDAVNSIRRQVFDRCKEHGCERCGREVTWGTFHLHEKVFRSHQGEQSLENCEGLCSDCHVGKPDSAHPGPIWTNKVKRV